jgi:hypothetical protein
VVCHIEEGHRLRVLKNRVLRKVFVRTRDEVIGKLRRLHEELYDLYCSENLVR